ncbi:MAG: hypothetical protein IH947_08780 [Bacteroidetes bacterium]|nr:hypothetical protein [Bacteroidota bacterium]
MNNEPSRTRAQESRAAIERIYIAMRHLFIRGSYKPMGMSGEALRSSLITLSPEIYGSIADSEKVELDGLLYVMERLPKGIEECRNIRLISREGLESSNFKAIIPPKRVRNCYRVDEEQMLIEMTRGRSDIYDILTHLTFVYNEAEKIRKNSLDYEGRLKRDWKRLEEIVKKEENKKKFNFDQANTYLSILLGRTYREVHEAGKKFAKKKETLHSLFHIIYWMGKLAIEEYTRKIDREITFSSILRQRVGHHKYGELWASEIKKALYEKGLMDRPIHIISANPHSVMNSIYALPALKKAIKKSKIEEVALILSKDKTGNLQTKVLRFAERHGLDQLDDTSGTNLTVQIIDTEKIPFSAISKSIQVDLNYIKSLRPVLVVMDYAFGEQAFETMDELLKPFEFKGELLPLNIKSVSVMGKAGILEGRKGDIMIPTAHVFEGTADNYPFNNDFDTSEFSGYGLDVVQGPMVTVLGTSLQNRQILRYFQKSSWNAVGLEMEGAHYQKAIQSAALIRKSIDADVKVRYAYYASDNPLETGGTLASGSLGVEGVRPAYLITVRILNKVLQRDA